MYKREYKHDGPSSQLISVIRRQNYHRLDDILEVHLRNKPVAGEVSQDGRVSDSYAWDRSGVIGMIEA